MTTVTKKTVTKKPAAKKPVPKKSVAKKVKAPVVAKPSENRVLYTIRLEPTIIAKLNELATKMGTTHAAVARSILAEGV